MSAGECARMDINGTIIWRIVSRALIILESFISVLVLYNTHRHTIVFVDGDESLNCSPFLACPVVVKECTSTVFTKVRCNAHWNQCIV